MAKKILIIVVIAAFVLIAASYWYWKSYKSELIAVPEGVAAPAEQLGADIFEKAQNPLKNELPTTNPFKQAETNPIVDVYRNPFSK
mgnify:CR=1 FL=1